LFVIGVSTRPFPGCSTVVQLVSSNLLLVIG